MPEDKPDNATSGLEKFTKTFLPYIMMGLALVQYIYSQQATQNQSVFVEIRDEQKKMNTSLTEVLKQMALNAADLERVKKDNEKQDTRMDNLETRQNNAEKNFILSNNGKR